MSDLICESTDTVRLCGCGCGQITRPYKKTCIKRGQRRGEYGRFLPGHYGRVTRAIVDTEFIATPKPCAACGAQLERGETESASTYRARKFCDQQCMGRSFSERAITRRPERFWVHVQKVENEDACWEWTSRRDYKGYGRWLRGTLAHRASFEFENGPIPKGLEVCHRCDNPLCVRPSHLFLGTHADNIRDMIAKGRAAFQRKTHCCNGHELTPENSVPRADRKQRGRRCRICVAESMRVRGARYRARIKARSMAQQQHSKFVS
jgi:hypothetical protein